MKKSLFFFLVLFAYSYSYSQINNNYAKHLVVIFDKSGSMQNKKSSQKKIIQEQLFNIIDTTISDGDYISVLKHGIEKNAKNFDDIFRTVQPYEYYKYSSDNKNQLQEDLLTIVNDRYYGNWNLSYPVPFLGMNFLNKNEINTNHYYVLYITDEQGVLGDLTHEMKQVKYARGGLLNIENEIEQILEINKYYYREVEHVFQENRVKMFLMEIRPLYSFIDLIYGFPTHPVTFKKTTKGYKYLLDLDVFDEDKKYLIEKVEIEILKNDDSQVFYKEYESLTDDLELELLLEDISFDDSYKLNMRTFVKYEAAGFDNFVFGCDKDIPNICNTIDKSCEIKFEEYEDVLWFTMNNGLFNLFAKDGENQSDAIHRLKMWFWISLIILIPILIFIFIVIRNSARNKKTNLQIGDGDSKKNETKKNIKEKNNNINQKNEIGKNKTNFDDKNKNKKEEKLNLDKNNKNTQNIKIEKKDVKFEDIKNSEKTIKNIVENKVNNDKQNKKENIDNKKNEKPINDKNENKSQLKIAIEKKEKTGLFEKLFGSKNKQKKIDKSETKQNKTNKNNTEKNKKENQKQQNIKKNNSKVVFVDDKNNNKKTINNSKTNQKQKVSFVNDNGYSKKNKISFED